VPPSRAWKKTLTTLIKQEVCVCVCFPVDGGEAVEDGIDAVCQGLPCRGKLAKLTGGRGVCLSTGACSFDRVSGVCMDAIDIY